MTSTTRAGIVGACALLAACKPGASHVDGDQEGRVDAGLLAVASAVTDSRSSALTLSMSWR